MSLIKVWINILLRRILELFMHPIFINCLLLLMVETVEFLLLMRSRSIATILLMRNIEVVVLLSILYELWITCALAMLFHVRC
jgi:hypothetical protein